MVLGRQSYGVAVCESATALWLCYKYDTQNLSTKTARRCWEKDSLDRVTPRGGGRWPERHGH